MTEGVGQWLSKPKENEKYFLDAKKGGNCRKRG
jgi:hypothetical protein